MEKVEGTEAESLAIGLKILKEVLMLKFENVSKVYADGFKAVDSVNFEIPEGEFLVLIGPSGSGKSTTMKMINRMIPHTNGTISIDGKDITKLNRFGTTSKYRICYSTNWSFPPLHNRKKHRNCSRIKRLGQGKNQSTSQRIIKYGWT